MKTLFQATMAHKTQHIRIEQLKKGKDKKKKNKK